MIVSRTTVRALRAGEQPADPMDGLDPDERAAMLKSLAGGSPLPVGGGLPGDEERKISGRAPPLSAQARTGRPSLLGDR
jgi:hypothetical protein